MNGPTQLETEAQWLADLNARESGIRTKESEIAGREISVAAREKQATAERQAIEQDKAKLTQREQAVTQAEQKRDAGFAAERAALNDELREKRVQGEKEITHTRENKLTALEDEIARLKAKRLRRLPMPKTSNGSASERKSPRSAMHGQNNRMTLDIG